MMDYSQMGAPPSDNILMGRRVTILTRECEIIKARGGGGGGLFCLGAVDYWLWGDYRAVISRNDRQFYRYTQTET
jgi:hypothetical protein